MKIEREKTGVKIGGLWVAFPDPDRARLFEDQARTPSPLEKIKELGLDLVGWPVMAAFLNADSEGQRRNLSTYDQAVLDAMHNVGVGKAVEQARRIMQDGDLRPEVKAQRAAEPLMQAAAAALDDALRAPLRSQIATLERWRKVLDAAFTPDKAEMGMEAAQELRMQETRRIVSEADDKTRIAILERIGQTGNLEALGALRSDPVGRKFASGEVMRQTERNALDAHGIGFIADDIEHAREMVEAAGYRAAAAVGVVLRSIPALAGGFKPGRLVGNDFEGMAAAAIAASE